MAKMAYKKRKKLPVIKDDAEKWLIFYRMMEEGRALNFKHVDEKIRAGIIDIFEGTIVAELKAVHWDAMSVRPGANLALVLYHEGKEIFGQIPVLGVGRYEGREAVRLGLPKALTVNDAFGLTQLHLSPRGKITFTSVVNNFCEGGLVNVGAKGVEIKSLQGGEVRELVAVDKETTVGFELSPEIKVACKGRVLYIQAFGERLIGVEFIDLDSDLETRIGHWVQEQIILRNTRDSRFIQEAMQRRTSRKRAAQARGEEVEIKGPRVREEYKVLYQEGEHYILILCRDKELLERMCKSLKRRYGVLVSKGRYSNVREIAFYYKPDLILVAETLGTVDGFDLVNTVNQHVEEKQAMVVFGDGDSEEKHARAREAGAVDYLDMSTFNPLTFYKKVEEKMAMFAAMGDTAAGSEPDGEPAPT